MIINKKWIRIVAVLALSVAGSVSADIVILKSGEMFQTRRAWKDNGMVYYYQGGQVVRVDAAAVERLIHSAAPVEAPPPANDRPSVPPPPAPAGDAPPVPAPPAASSADDATGFIGLKWGQAPSTIDGLTLVETDPAYGGVAQYRRKGRSPRFGRAPVDNVFFGFWQGGLYTILVEVSNYLDFMELKVEAFRRFGPGVQQNPHMERYRWQAPFTDRMLTYDDASGTGYLWMRSRVLHEKVRQRYPD